MRTEPDFFGLVSVCSCATSRGVHKVRKITSKHGNFPMSLTTRNGYTAPTDSNLSAPFRLRKLSLVPAFLHVQIARIQSVIKANVSIGVGTRRFHSKPGHRVMSVMTIFRQ